MTDFASVIPRLPGNETGESKNASATGFGGGIAADILIGIGGKGLVAYLDGGRLSPEIIGKAVGLGQHLDGRATPCRTGQGGKLTVCIGILDTGQRRSLRAFSNDPGITAGVVVVFVQGTLGFGVDHLGQIIVGGIVGGMGGLARGIGDGGSVVAVRGDRGGAVHGESPIGQGGAGDKVVSRGMFSGTERLMR